MQPKAFTQNHSLFPTAALFDIGRAEGPSQLSQRCCGICREVAGSHKPSLCTTIRETCLQSQQHVALFPLLHHSFWHPVAPKSSLSLMVSQRTPYHESFTLTLNLISVDRSGNHALHYTVEPDHKHISTKCFDAEVEANAFHAWVPPSCRVPGRHTWTQFTLIHGHYTLSGTPYDETPVANDRCVHMAPSDIRRIRMK